jgi:outer membrane lipoprotein-sorting protein
MTINKILSLTILALTVSQLCFAQPKGFTQVASLDKVKEQMKTVGANQKTIQSSFSQIKKMEYLDIAIQSEGKFWYSAPSQVRWEYITPYEYTIIINKGKLSLISGTSKNDFNLENSEIFEQINSLMVGSVTGNIFESADYTIKVYENNTQYLFSLLPGAKFMEGVITKIEMLLDKNSGIVTSIKMIEAEDNFSEISFKNIKINEPISEKIFIP